MLAPLPAAVVVAVMIALTSVVGSAVLAQLCHWLVITLSCEIVVCVLHRASVHTRQCVLTPARIWSWMPAPASIASGKGLVMVGFRIVVFSCV